MKRETLATVLVWAVCLAAAFTALHYLGPHHAPECAQGSPCDINGSPRPGP